MHIGIDATCWWNRRGFGRFTRGLLQAMFSADRGHTFSLFVDQDPEPAMIGPNRVIVRIAATSPVTQSAIAGRRRSLSDVWRYRKAVAATNPDVMFFPAVYSWFPTPSQVPIVVTLHDAIAERFPGMIFGTYREQLFWKLKMKLACRQAASLLTVSDAARLDIVERIGVETERIGVICEGTESRFRPVLDQTIRMRMRARANLPSDKRLLLYVGAPAPHKNIPTLLRAFAEVALRLSDVDLAIVGDLGGDGFFSHTEQIRAVIRDDPRLEDRVHLTGFISDEDLPSLYSDALALVLPSFAEGFGLPVLEGMACGAPVIVSRISALMEVVGDAGLTFNPSDAEALAAAITDIASRDDLRLELRRRALMRAPYYTWDRAAALTLDCLERSIARESCASA